MVAASSSLSFPFCHAPGGVIQPPVGDHRIAIQIADIPRKSTRLGIEHILGYSPQARGRSERANRTLQERLRVLVRRHLNGQPSV